ncbi:hypothetical protein O3354_002444 [Salmonella enterica subsp. enterica serovar Newport]|jgi:hypothetical protein|uniref:Uncharacterized protein n=1 Tax=Salmonella enterica subsp. enterica serovar Schwarzengrund TaxID=340190 RepID=A0A5W3ES02_SALET|nr:hypothetical protein [Escherichia coli]EBR8168387.1 hypothetical protein [Salmonella enterica subsp. enterica serovar Virchow]EBW6073578.1 hypothetical protein [Salmonella enterica subsp. enterica serovar Schwarzengrund]ECJ4589169.1 hypothetical protein [Salmonella enterica subsp. enterica]ECM9141024.1 hypothetical protein [Salmonella enterica subsp. enterica serovar Enteritidis]ECS6386431.1 hypothetical protein [Salmonella enterica subsp. enterica serovar Saintpaul]EKG5865183.1 hypothetic
MINLYSLNAVTNAMKLAKQHQVRLEADVDSPVGLLTKATTQQSVFDTQITDEEFFQSLPDITALKTPQSGTGEASVIADTAAGPETLNVEDHEPTLFELKRMAIQRCQGMLDFARNVIQPFVQLVIQNNQGIENQAVSEEWALVPAGMDPALNSPVVQALIDSVENPLGNGTTHPAVKANVPADIELPETGSKAYDDLVKELLNALGWNINEAVRNMLEGNMLSPVSDQAPHNLKRNILFMLLSGYYLEMPWKDSGLNSGQWKAQMLPLHYSYIGWVYAYTQNIVTRIKTGNIVFGYDNVEKKVYICQEVMDDYLEKGGSVEALLGAIYQLDEGDTNVSTRVASLLEKQKDYIAAWGHRSAIQRAKLDSSWVTRNRQSLKQAFNVAIDATDPELFWRGQDGQVATPEFVKKSTASFIDSFFTTDTTDITEFVIKVSATEVFGEYELSKLMLDIHRGMIANRQPDEVATDWMINYVLDWICGGVVISVPSKV